MRCRAATPTPALAACASAAVVLAVGPARAEDPFHFPGQGTRDLGRAGASTARADDAHAPAINPAGLAGQPTRLRLDAHLAFNEVCYQRSGFASTLQVGPREVAYPEVCNESTPTPLPMLGFTWAASERLGLGLLISPPMVYGRMRFPATVTTPVDNPITGTTQQVPIAAPQRYMLLEQDGFIVNAYLGAGYAVTEQISLGVAFIAGTGSIELASGAMSLPSPTQARDDPPADVRADVEVADPFIPGVVVGARWTPTRALAVGASVTAQEAFDGKGDLTASENYWTVSQGIDPSPDLTRSTDYGEDLARFRLQNPLVARLGASYHVRRAEGSTPGHDPLADDVANVEVGLTYTRTSVHRTVVLRFPERPIIQLGQSGGAVPQQADVPVYLKGDSLGARGSVEWVPLPRLLLVRAGAWYEPDVQRPEYLNVTQLASERIGITLGGDVRLGPVDVSAGYALVLFGEVDNQGAGRARAISGDANASPPYRTPYPINGGRATQQVHLASLGASYRF